MEEIKLKQLSEDCDRKIASLNKEIDQQLRLANDKLSKSEEKTQEILWNVEKSNASKI